MGIRPHTPPIANGLYYVRDAKRGVIALRPVVARKRWTCAVTGRPILTGERCLAPLPPHGQQSLRVSFDGWNTLLAAREAETAGASPSTARPTEVEPDPVFAALCQVLLRQAAGLVVKRRDADALILDLPRRRPSDPERLFAAAVSSAEGALLQLVPLRYWPDLADGLPRVLDEHRRGCSGFLFPTPHSEAFADLASLAHRARARCVAEGLAPE